MLITRTIAALVPFCLVLVGGCGKPSTPSSAPAAGASSKSDAAPPALTGHHGPAVALGTAMIGPFTVRAARDAGEIRAGGDAPIDVWLTGSPVQVRAVRFWIGTEAGTESVKARADIENPAEPNHWHTHAEIPSPMPDSSMLWVEIEVEDGSRHTGSFPLAGP